MISFSESLYHKYQLLAILERQEFLSCLLLRYNSLVITSDDPSSKAIGGLHQAVI